MCRVISYNIHSGVGRDRKRDFRRIGNYLADSNADLVLLQEMDTRNLPQPGEQSVRDICAGNVFNLVPSPAIQNANGWYGNALLSRLPVITSETLDVSQPGRQPRNVQTVEVQTRQGPLTIINTHKGLKKLERRAQFHMLHSYIQQRMKNRPAPLLLAGDFNEWQFFTSAFKALNRLLDQHRFGATFPSHCPLFALDRAWTSKHIRLLRAKKLNDPHTRVFSDHLPIQMDLKLR